MVSLVEGARVLLPSFLVALNTALKASQFDANEIDTNENLGTACSDGTSIFRGNILLRCEKKLCYIFCSDQTFALLQGEITDEGFWSRLVNLKFISSSDENIAERLESLYKDTIS